MNNLFTVPELGYGYDALERAVSADIMRLHHDKHHQAYVDKLNIAVQGLELADNMSLEQILRRLDVLPEEVRMAVRNNGGGHYNHSLFWRWMSPEGGGEPGGELADRLNSMYGGFQQFVDVFNEKALGLFGSGWVWLQPDLSIVTTANQDNPIMNGEGVPVLGLDVWEHAYYLDYKNVRADYVKAWWDVIDWRFIESRIAR